MPMTVRCDGMERVKYIALLESEPREKAMLTHTVDRGPIAPTADELSDLEALKHLVFEHGAHELTVVGRPGEAVPIGDAALRVLRRAVDVLARDHVVSLSSTSKDFTLHQVADLLDVPYADAIRRVEEHGVPTYELNGLRRVRFENAIILKQERDVERREALQFLADQGQEIQAILDRQTGRESLTSSATSAARNGDDS